MDYIKNKEKLDSYMMKINKFIDKALTKIISYNVTYVECPIFYMHYGRKNYEV